MNSDLFTISRFVLVIVTGLMLVYFGYFLLGRRDRGARAPLRIGGIAAPVLGVAVLGVLLFAEVRRIAAPPGRSGGDDVVHLVDGVPNAEDRTDADRLQVLVVVSDASGVMRPYEVHERILDLPADPSEEFGFVLREVDSNFSFRWPGRHDVGNLSLDVRTTTATSHRMSATVGPSRRDRIDLGDGRGFAMWISGHRLATGFGLRDPAPMSLQLLFRGLAPGDRLVERPVGDVIDRFAEAARSGMLLASFSSHVEPLPSDPVRRIAGEWNGLGVLLLVNGVLLLLGGFASRLRGAAAAAVFLVVLTSIACRVDTMRAEALIRHADPDVRAAAAVRLASQRAFAPRASEALRDAFERETRADLRAAYLLAAVSDGNPMIDLPAVDQMIARANDDPSEAVRKVALEIREHREQIASERRD